MALALIPNIAGGGGGGSVNSVTFGAGMAQSGTAADPVGDVACGDGSLTINANDMQVSAAYTAAVAATAAAAAAAVVEHTGIAVLDFGATPQTDATVAVAGQAGILATSRVQCWFQGDTTAENTEADHLLAAQAMGVGAGIPTAGVGFTIDATAIQFLVTGTLKCRWAWQ